MMSKIKDWAIAVALCAVVIAASAVTYRQFFPAGSGGGTVVPEPQEFAQRVRESFTGEKADRVLLVALFSQASVAITYDGTTESPQLQTTNEAFECHRKILRYYFGKDKTPYADKYPEFRKVVADELYKRLGQEEGGEDKELTPELRTAMAQVFAEVADALRE